MKTPFTLLRSKLQYLFLLYAFLGFLAPSNAQGIHIPDDNFAAAIRSVCPTCINAMDTLLPPAASITNLNIENKGIVSLSGLHGFSSLQTLWAVDNQVTVLPTLPNSLTYLGMRGNLLTSLPTLPTGLMTLDVDQNPVTSLPALPVGLKYLWVQGGALTSLPALPSSLEWLYCRGNQLTSLPSLPASLLRLDCYNNQITSLPILPSGLTELGCQLNQLTQLPALPSNLTKLFCGENQLTQLPTLPNTLTELSCVATSITSLPTLPSTLTKLYIDNESIICLPNSVIGLQVYNRWNNPIATPPVCGVTLGIHIPDDNFAAAIRAVCPTCINTLDTLMPPAASLTFLDVTNKNIANVAGLEGFSGLRTFICNQNQLTSLPALPSTLTYLSCQDNQLTSLPTLPVGLTTLSCDENQITTLPALPSTLVQLFCNNNRLTSLPTLTSLTHLFCSSNQLTSLPSLPNSLEGLFCGVNQLSSLPTLPNSLTELNCPLNQITSLPALPSALIKLTIDADKILCLPNSVSGLKVYNANNVLITTPIVCGTTPPSLGIHIPDDNFAAAIRALCPTCINASDTLMPPAASITNLNLENKGIVSLSGLHGFSSLQTLWAVDNQIAVLPTLPTTLTLLGMRGNQLTTVPTLPSGLTILDLDGNPVTSLPALPSGLTQLWVQGCQLSSLPTLPSSLQLIYCINNQLTSLPTLPISLTKLECRGNQLSSLPALPNSLTELVCYANQLTSLPTLPNSLTKLSIDADKILCLPNSVSGLQVYNASNVLITPPVCGTTPPSLGIHIPDANFAAAIRAVCPTCINASDTLMPPAASFSFLDVENKNIESLEGLHGFTNLQTLVCKNNRLTGLPTLPSTLVQLDCSQNQLTSLPDLPNGVTYFNCLENQLTSLPNLPGGVVYFYCSSNQLTNLPALPSTLTYFHCFNNQLTSLPTLPDGLPELNCSNNQLTSLPSLPSSLVRLFCGVNQLTSLPNLPNSLTEVNCPLNQITSLPTLPSALTRLTIDADKITCLPNSVPGLQVYNANYVLITTPYVCGTTPPSLGIHIPDANFAVAIRAVCPTCINASDTLMPPAAEINTLEVMSKNITDLTGLHGFTSLYRLDVRHNQLTTLPIWPSSTRQVIAANNQLTSLPSLPEGLLELIVANNQLTSVPTLPSTLTNLTIDPDKITCLPNHVVGLKVYRYPADATFEEIPTPPICGTTPPSLGIHIPDANFAAAIRALCPTCINASDTLMPPAASITNLNLENRGIASLSGVHGFSSLQTLWAVDNQISVLPTLPTTLTSLGMRGNQLTTVPTLPSGLTILDLDGNPVTSLPALPSGLTQLWVQGCQLSSLPTLPSGLQLLYCINNQLTSLPALPSTLTKIECRGNQITSLPTLPSSLTELVCYANQITSLPTLPSSLTKLYIDADKITCLPNSVAGLQVYNASSTLITPPVCTPPIHIPDANFAAAIRVVCPTCINSNDDLLPPAASLTSLDVSNRSIANLTGIHGFTALQFLNCRDNQLTSLPTLPVGLRVLDCTSNPITSLPALPNTLAELYAQNNQLTSLPALPATLTALYCNGNPQLSGLPVLPNNLQTLSSSGNNLTTLPTLPSTLTNLECTNNKLTSLPALPNTITRLLCDNNQLASLPTLPTTLTVLSCSNNQLTILPALPSSLTQVWVRTNQLTSLPTLPGSLTKLACNSNQLTSLPTLPSSLSELYIDADKITCLPNSVAGLQVYDANTIITTPPVCVPCEPPTGRQWSNTTATSTQPYWQAETGKSYKVRWKLTSAANWTESAVLTPANSGTYTYTITGLTNGSTYEWQVQSICNNVGGSFSSSIPFTTSCQPGNLGTPQPTSTTASLQWDNFGIPLNFNLRWRKIGEANWTTANNISGTLYSINGLTEATPYEVQIQTICADASTSNFSDSKNFTTAGIHIPDANFAAAIRAVCPTCINSNDDLLPPAASLTQLNVANKNIVSLTGIHGFTALQTLDCGQNQLIVLPALPIGLISLECISNKLTALPTLPSSLTYLGCIDNKITVLPTLPASLTSLNCGINLLTSLPSLPNGLTRIECTGNQLTSLPSLPNTVTNLYCRNNQLTSLPALPSSLITFWCEANQLTGLPTLPTSLTDLQCHSNQITSLPALPNSLTKLTIDADKITCLPNLVSGLQVYNAANTLITTPPACIHIPDANFAAAIRAVCPTCINSNDDLLPPAASLTSLDVSNKSIANLTGIHGFTALTHLNCGQNQLTSLPVLPSALYELYCSENQITSLPTLPSGLVNLYCEGNKIATLPTLPNGLVDLFCSTNLLTTLPVLPNSIKKIYCGQNQIAVLPTLPTALVTLECRVNQLSSLPVLPNTITLLAADVNQLTSLTSLPSSVTQVWLNNNQLTSLPALPSGLTKLVCSSNALTSLPTLPGSLSELICSSNQIAFLPTLPNSLTKLYIDADKITCLPNSVAGLQVYNASSALITTPPVCIACEPPTGRQWQNTTATSTQPYWQAEAGKSYKVRWKLTSAANWTESTVLTPANSGIYDYTITGLTNGSTYEWQVQSICNNVGGAFSPSAVFTTACQPGNLSTPVPGSTSASLQWGNFGIPLSFNLRWRKTSDVNWSISERINNTSFTITGLDAASLYEVQIQTICADGSTSNFSDSKNFATLGINIPDSAFAQAIREVCPTCIDANNNLLPPAANLTSLDVSNKNIRSLEGIQGFTALVTLDCSGNALTTLPVLPSTLLRLDCSDNQISDFGGDASLNLPRGRRMAGLSSSVLPSGLLELDCSNNQLVTLPPLPLSLTKLNCSENELTSLPPLPPSLTNLNCSDNNLSSLPPLPPTLTEFNCSNSQAAPVVAGVTICKGTEVTLKATGCSGTDNVLKWFNAVENTLVNMPVAPSTTTRYYAKCDLIVGNITCTSAASDTVSIVVLNPNTPVAAGASICSGGSITLSAAGCVGEGAILKWYKVSDNVLVTMPISPTSTTDYYAKCEQILNGTACISPSSNHVSVVVNSVPSATLTGNATVCLNATSPIVTFTGSAGKAPYVFTYRINGGIEQAISTVDANSLVATLPVSTQNATSYKYVLTNIKDANGCQRSFADSAIVHVNGKPTVSLRINEQEARSGGTYTLCDIDTNPINTLQANVMSSCVSGDIFWRVKIGTEAWSLWQLVAPSSQPSNGVTYFYQAACNNTNCATTVTDAISITVNYRSSMPQSVSLIVDDVNVLAGASSTICDKPGDKISFLATCASGEILLYSVDGADYSSIQPTQIIDNSFHNYRVRCRKSDGTLSCVETESEPMRIKIVAPSRNPVVSISPMSTCGISSVFSSTSTCAGAQSTVWYDATSQQVLDKLPATTPTVTSSYYARCKTSEGCLSEPSNVVTFTVVPVGEAPLVKSSGEVVCTGTSVTLSASCPQGANVIWNNQHQQETLSVAFNSPTRQQFTARCVFQGGCKSVESQVVTVVWKAFNLTLINIGSSKSGIKEEANPTRDAWQNQFINGDAGPTLELSNQTNPTIFYSENANKVAPRYWTINVETCNLGTEGSLTFDMLATPEVGRIRSFNTHENNAPYFMYGNRDGFTELYAQNHPAYGFYESNGSGGNIYDEGLPKGLYKLSVRYWDMKGWGSIYPATRKAQGNVLAYQEYWFRIQSKEGIGKGAAKIASTSFEEDVSFGAMVSPNPVVNALSLSVKGLQNQSVNITLLDVTGRVLMNRNVTPEAPLHNEYFDFSHRETGMYLLSIQSGERKMVLKVMKVQ